MATSIFIVYLTALFFRYHSNCSSDGDDNNPVDFKNSQFLSSSRTLNHSEHK